MLIKSHDKILQPATFCYSVSPVQPDLEDSVLRGRPGAHVPDVLCQYSREFSHPHRAVMRQSGSAMASSVKMDNPGVWISRIIVFSRGIPTPIHGLVRIAREKNLAGHFVRDERLATEQREAQPVPIEGRGLLKHNNATINGRSELERCGDFTGKPWAPSHYPVVNQFSVGAPASQRGHAGGRYFSRSEQFVEWAFDQGV